MGSERAFHCFYLEGAIRSTKLAVLAINQFLAPAFANPFSRGLMMPGFIFGLVLRMSVCFAFLARPWLHTKGQVLGLFIYDVFLIGAQSRQ